MDHLPIWSAWRGEGAVIYLPVQVWGDQGGLSAYQDRGSSGAGRLPTWTEGGVRQAEWVTDPPGQVGHLPTWSDGLFTLSVSGLRNQDREKMGCMKLYRTFHITQGPGPHCFLLCWSRCRSLSRSRSKPV